jgi:hypothetical protein
VLCREVSSTVGGGVCGAAPSLFLRWAADKAAMAEKAKKADDTDRFCKLTESARMDIVYAHERAAKAAAVGSSSGPSAHEVLAKALLEPETGRAK